MTAANSQGWGAEAIQAICLTLEKIGIELYTSAYHEAGELVWTELGKGYGFPVPGNARHLLVGGDRYFDGMPPT